MTTKLFALIRPVLVSTLRAVGDIRARLSTGGGSMYARHFYSGGSAGGFHVQDTDGTETFALMPDASPNPSNITIQVGTGAGSGILRDAFSLKTADGLVTVPKLSNIARVSGGDGVRGSTTPLLVNSEASQWTSGTWLITGWRLAIDVNGAFRVEVMKCAYSAYTATPTWTTMSGASTGSGGMPRISGLNSKNTDTSLTGWSDTTINDGDMIGFFVRNNGANAGYYRLQLFGTQVNQ